MERRGKTVPHSEKVVADDPSLLPSDDEDDDFVASLSEDDGGSDSSDSDTDRRQKKKSKVNHDSDNQAKEPVLDKAALDDLWASFNAAEDPYATTSSSAAAPNTSTPTLASSTKNPDRKKIKIPVTYQFVNETITEDKEVWEDSEEAKAWMATQPKKKNSEPSLSTNSNGKLPEGKGSNVSTEDALFGLEPSTNTSEAVTASEIPQSSAIDNNIVARKGPSGPRRAAGGGLAALAGALNGKPQKLNTLEKSKMDWNKFVSSEELTDDLTKARKDGYLDKQDFLNRTEQRKEDDYDRLKSSGRR